MFKLVYQNIQRIIFLKYILPDFEALKNSISSFLVILGAIFNKLKGNIERQIYNIYKV